MRSGLPIILRVAGPMDRVSVGVGRGYFADHGLVRQAQHERCVRIETGCRAVESIHAYAIGGKDVAVISGQVAYVPAEFERMRSARPGEVIKQLFWSDSC